MKVIRTPSVIAAASSNVIKETAILFPLNFISVSF
jgi:hypothetical protein